MLWRTETSKILFIHAFHKTFLNIPISVSEIQTRTFRESQTFFFLNFLQWNFFS